MIGCAIMKLRNTKLSNLLFSYVFLVEFLKNTVSFASNVSNNSACYNETCTRPSLFQPHSPLILCSYLPREFMICDPPLDLNGNDTARSVLGYGCSKFGGTRYEEVQKTPLLCHAIEEIECYGNRTFLADMQPCIKYSGHYFVTTLLYSVLLGFLGVDRFCLGHTGSAVGKLLTLGGLGVWWFVDIILLVLGQLNPEDGSNWNQYY